MAALCLANTFRRCPVAICLIENFNKVLRIELEQQAEGSTRIIKEAKGPAGQTTAECVKDKEAFGNFAKEKPLAAVQALAAAIGEVGTSTALGVSHYSS